MIVFAESWFDRRFLNLSLSKRTQAAFPAKCKPISRQADAQRYWSGCGALIAQSDRYSWVDRWPFQSNFSSSRGSCRSWWTWVLCSCGVWWSVRLLEPTGVREFVAEVATISKEALCDQQDYLVMINTARSEACSWSPLLGRIRCSLNLKNYLTEV